MKKISKLLMFAVLALGLSFAACNNDDVPQGPDQKEGNTHVSVALSMSASNFKSAVSGDDKDFNYVGEWAGKDVIKTVSIYLVDPASTGPVTRRNFDVGSHTDVNKPYYTTDQSGGTLNIIPREAAAIKTSAGPKDVWVVINENTAVQQHLATATAADFAKKYQQIALVLENSGYDFDPEPATSAAKLAKVEAVGGEDYDVIVMTNVEPSINFAVEAGVTAATTIADATKNRASLEVERAVARVLVTLKDGYTEDIKDANGNTIGTISEVRWVLAQGENSLFVQREKDWKTPNFTWLPEADADYWNEAGGKYDYSGLYEGWKAAPLFGGNALTGNPSNGNKDDENAGNIGAASIGNGRFILPTTHTYGLKEASSYKKGNTAYVLVRALFTPAADAIVDGGTLTDGTFYLGANGKIYSSASAAINPATGGAKGQTVAKYVGGKVLYYAWVNPDEIPAWYNSPVLRNNIYHINITGFKNLGTNWNPLFPENPDDPKNIPYTPNPGYDPEQPFVPGTNEPFMPNEDFDPGQPIGPGNEPFLPNPGYDPEQPTTPGTNTPTSPNNNYVPSQNPDPKPFPEVIPNPDPENPGTPITPEEPTNPIDPKDPLTTPETWMSVDVKVLPWKVHSYEIEL